jgi:hypothetical protein
MGGSFSPTTLKHCQGLFSSDVVISQELFANYHVPNFKEIIREGIGAPLVVL